MNGKKRHQGNLLDAHSVLAKLQLQPNSRALPKGTS
ncbi:hypothetical protein HaLaN_07076 [Haematococcus lacustris]|uniref:Uncharacterized protein n=1 Tax=Haematococcus lacustris TaxID=44745 RepID=A0A699YNK0_HAELA|nr:hypothetical protein HaLaN_07076 [Haematococcus lacustris]